jgi:hypothetical protein
MVDDNPSDDPCLGCWILDGTSVFKTDGDLNETYEISSLSDPSLVCVNHSNRGCYVVDDSLGLLSFDSVGDLIGSGSFTDPSVIGAFANSEGDLYVLTEDDLYKFINVDGNISLSVTFNLSSFLTSQMVIGCFDIDTGTDYIYTGSGDNSTIRIVKFDSDGAHLGTVSTSGDFPYVIRASQHPSSDTFYVLSDDSKIEVVQSSSSSSSEMFSDPSSSSSDSSAGFSSSSSSSSEQYSSSSSSSSSSSEQYSSSSSSSSEQYSSSSSSSSSEQYSSSSSSEQYSSSSSSSFFDSCLEEVLTTGAGHSTYGQRVSIQENYAVVGDPGIFSTDRGDAYIYRRTGDNTWGEETFVDASDEHDTNRFAASVSISGNYLGVGAWGDNEGGANSGAAYIYRRNGLNTWGEELKITASDAEGSARFGMSVSMDGDYFIVGADLDNGTGGAVANSGAAYIYRRNGLNSWANEFKILATSEEDNAGFGVDVAISGDYAIVGARFEGATGAAYIYHRIGSTTWDTGVRIVAFDANDNDRFGGAVAISGDYAIVGAASEDGDGTDKGAAYVFRRTGTNTWDSGTKIVASNGIDNDGFGTDVAIDGDDLVVGTGFSPSVRQAYVFRRNGTNSWEEVNIFADASVSSFGRAVSIKESYIMLGTSADQAHVFFCEELESESSTSSESVGNSSSSSSSEDYSESSSTSSTSSESVGNSSSSSSSEGYTSSSSTSSE